MRTGPMLLLAIVALAACSTPAPTAGPPSTSGPTATATVGLATAEPAPARSTTPEGWLAPPCTGGLVIGGDFVGEAHGPMRSTNRHTPSDARGVVIEAILPVDGSPGPASFHLGIIDVDGPGPKPVSLLFGQETPAPLVAHGWEAGRDAGTAIITDDASVAMLDVTFPTGDASGGTPGSRYTLMGTITCPPLPPAAAGSS
jgi:hypothetical protein